MSVAPKTNDAVQVSRIFLSLSNPRHEPVDSEAKAIQRLCDKGYVYPLARDIRKHGLNPLERFALIPVDKKNAGKPRSSYNVAEGNRRICAIKLLNDPELAPASYRKQFAKSAPNWTPVKTVSSVIFDDIDDVDLWLSRVHKGRQSGIGRKEWNADQKARHDGSSKNRGAQALLDYAEQEGMITAQERVGKLTTVQRFLVNDVFREFLGLDQSDPDELARNRPKAEFNAIMR